MLQGLVRGANLVLADRVCRGQVLWQDGVIRAIDTDTTDGLGQQVPPELPVWDLQGDLLIPGLIDTHVHGAGGFDVMDGTLDSLQTIARTLLAEGTTAFLPTTMSALPEQVQQSMRNITSYRQEPTDGAEVLGVHVEGPFLAPQYKGAQAGDMIWDVPTDTTTQFLVDLFQGFPGLIRILTFAPERPDGQALAQICLSHGVIPSAGHTAAGYAQMEQAVQWGIRHITHAFNAMPGIHHRNPGLLTQALLDDRVTLELIVDGVHIHPAIVELVLKNKRPDRVCLVSDGIRAIGMPEGEYEFGGQQTVVHQGIARLADGTIAGSAYPLRQGLKILRDVLGYSLPQAVRYVTLTPAKLLGVDQRLGSLDINKDATFIRLSAELNVKQVWLKGRLVVDNC